MKRAELERLETALREDARHDTPPFSIPLHQRVMGALREQSLPQTAPRIAAPGRSWTRRIALPTALAAGLAIVAWIVLRPTPPQAPAPAIVNNSTVPAITLPEIQPAPIPDAALADGKYAYLDRDAMRLWLFVANQLPELPEPK